GIQLQAIEFARRLSTKIVVEGRNPQNSLLISLLAGNSRRRLVRIGLHPQPTSAVSVGHVQAGKIVTTFPRLSRISVSLCNPNFFLLGDLSRFLRASLWPPNFNFQIANSRLISVGST